MTELNTVRCPECKSKLVYAKGFGMVCPNPTDHDDKRVEQIGVTTYA